VAGTVFYARSSVNLPQGLSFDGDILSVNHSQLADLVPPELFDEVVNVISTSIQVNPCALILLSKGLIRVSTADYMDTVLSLPWGFVHRK
jgi:hypothetical protein